MLCLALRDYWSYSASKEKLKGLRIIISDMFNANSYMFDLMNVFQSFSEQRSRGHFYERYVLKGEES